MTNMCLLRQTCQAKQLILYIFIRLNAEIRFIALGIPSGNVVQHDVLVRSLVNVTTGGWKVSKHGAKRPQKPYGLLGMGRRGERDGGGGGGGGGILYTYCYTATIRVFPALRWAAMRAILMFQ